MSVYKSQMVKAVVWRFKRQMMGVIAIATTIALGSAAAIVAINVVNAVLLRALPYEEAERLVVISDDRIARNIRDYPFSDANFIDLRTRAARTFVEFAAIQAVDGILPGMNGEPEAIRIALVTPNFFTFVGTSLHFGAGFSLPELGNASAAREPGYSEMNETAVISHAYWNRRFGGRLDILDQRLYPDGPVISGVLPRNFELFLPAVFNVDRRPDLWLPRSPEYDVRLRDVLRLRVLGRLRPGTSVEQAQQELNGVAETLRREEVGLQVSGFRMRAEPLGEYIIAPMKPGIVALSVASVLLMILALGNILTFSVIVTIASWRESMIRIAFGASTVAEGMGLIGLTGLATGAGLLVALVLSYLVTNSIKVVAPMNWLRFDGIETSWRVYGVVAVASLVATLAVGGMVFLVTIFKSRWNLRPRPVKGVRRFLGLSVVFQSALSLVLLVALGRGVDGLGASPGYEAKAVLTFKTLFPPEGSAEARQLLMLGIRDRLLAIPGIEAAGAASPFPLADPPEVTRWGTVEALADPSLFQAAEAYTVLPGYFETLGIGLIAGQLFDESDNSTTGTAVIVDETLAARAFPNQAAIGRQLVIRLRNEKPDVVHVVGVVGRQMTSLQGQGDEVRPQFFVPDGYRGHGRAVRWAVKVKGSPAAYDPLVKAALGEVSRRIVTTEATPMESMMAEAQSSRRVIVLILALLSLATVLVTCVGLYGVTFDLVQSRRSEARTRAALGCSPARLVLEYVLHGLRYAVAGCLLAVAVLYYLDRTGAFLSPASRQSGYLVSAAVVMLWTVMAVASWLPAKAASLSMAISVRD